MPEAPIASARIPLTVVGGFLGSGKTSLLNRVLERLDRVRAAVLVNDFGSINVDKALIVGHGGDTISLRNGCVCCSIGGDLGDALIDVMSRTPRPEWIVIEASGVADPWRIAQVGLADPGLQLDGVVVLVDCAAARAQLADPLLEDTLVRQIRAADVVVLNKQDLADRFEVQALRETIGRLAPSVAMLETSFSDVPLAILTSLAGAARSPRDRGDAMDAAHGAQFETVTLTFDARFHAAGLRALLAHMPEGVLRAKGLVRTDEADAQVLQFCGRHGSLRNIAGAATESLGRIVAIGLRGRLPVASLERALAEVVTG